MATLMLRTRDPREAELHNARLAANIQGLSVVRPDADLTYITLLGTMDGRACTALAPLQSLLDFCLGASTIPAELLDPTIAKTFLCDALRKHGLPSPSQVLQWTGIGGRPTGSELEKPFLGLVGGPFDVLLPALPSDFFSAVNFRQTNLPVLLTWSLGWLKLPAMDWAQLEAGDAIRLPDAPGRIHAGTYFLYFFRLDGDTLMTEILPQDTAFDVEDEPADPGSINGATLAALPVTVEFVLMQRAMTVAEIGGLQVGMTLPMGGTTPYVDLMAGSVRVARAELVRLGQDLAVEIVELGPWSPDMQDPASS